MYRTSTKNLVGRILAVLAIALSMGGVITGIVIWQLLAHAGVFEPDDHLIEKITTHETRSNTLVLARDGSRIGEFYEYDRIFIPFSEIPPIFLNAIVSIEDQSFWKHSGVDPRGIVRAAIANISGGKTRQGASTISQQLVKSFILGRERTFKRKAREIFLALKLERMISKQRIIELYANEMFLGNGSYGIGAAAKRYFNKSVQELGIHEVALIAGLFQSPSSYNPVRHPTRAKARQRQVLQAMFRNRFITRAERDELIKRPLAFQKSFSGIDVDFAPWFLDQVREDANKILGTDIKGSSLVIRTTLDPHLQKFAVNAIREGSDNFRRFERGGRVEAALLATNHATGAILAMAGGRDYRTSQFNRATSARRHPGSAFKTFVYALALQQGWTWSDRLFIDPVQINGYKPRNLTDEFFTEMTLLRSFYRSLNTPAVEVAHKLGVGNVIQFAEKLGVRSPLKHELGTALGGSSVTLQDMAAAYGTIANGGQLREPYTIESISKRGGEALYSHNSRKNPDSGVIDPQTAWLVTEGLRAVMRHGTASGAAQLANMAVGKTGTSNEGVDSWFAGYTATITAIVWSGRDDHQPLPEATGAGLALPVWQDFISKSLTLPTWRHRFTKPDGIIEDRIDPTYGRPSINGMVMAFRAGTRPSGASIQRNSPGELVKSVEGDINGGAAGLRDGSEVPDIFAR